MSGEVLVKIEGVRKKFCRSLKKSLWYGMKDMTAEMIGGSRRHEQLREGEFWAVNDVSFELKRGECLGLIGHNGAGKTTLLKMLNGLIKPDVGRIEMRGRIGALIALGAGFNPILTGRENIYVNGSVLGLTRKEIDAKMEDIIDFTDIRGFIDAPVQSYSSGMAVRLGFAIAAHCRPDVLLLDEVLAVGDVAFQAKCFNKLAEFREKGVAFILVSHNMHQISRYCNHVLYMRHGRIAHLGEAEVGIEHFLRDMSAQEPGSTNETTDWSKAYGSGKVMLKKATFLNEAGEKIEQIKPGDTFTLAIDYECPKEDVDDAVLDIIIRDKEGVLFQGTSKDFNASFGSLNQNGQLLVTFEKMPANGAEVQFFFSLLSGKTAEVFDWKRHVRLKIENNPKLHGRLVLDVGWSSKSYF